jgi:hypothetical protein
LVEDAAEATTATSGAGRDVMISDRGYTAGWFDSSIHDFLKEMSRPFANMQVALITCLDSSTDLSPLIARSPGLKRLGPHFKPLGKGLLVSTKRLLDIEKSERIFFGFDEVWFFPKEPREPKPDAVCLVGPGRIDQESLRLALPWMSLTSCSIGLGDGIGLNVMAKAHGLARYLVAHSVNQPAPQR